jgi:hypothetical protein
VYKQAVTPEDMFLGMSGRDPSTHCCEDLVVRGVATAAGCCPQLNQHNPWEPPWQVKIKLPGTKMAQVNLDVTDKVLDLRAPAFRLHLPLPHSVDSKNGVAKWDAAKETLIVTLRMVREFDFLRA